MADYPLTARRTESGAVQIRKQQGYVILAYRKDELHSIMAAIDILSSTIGEENIWIDTQPKQRLGVPMQGFLGIYVKEQFVSKELRQLLDDHYYRNLHILGQSNI